jgi:hypothetical protein
MAKAFVHEPRFCRAGVPVDVTTWKDDPDARHGDHPIVDRRDSEWWHPSHTFFLATFAPADDPE